MSEGFFKPLLKQGHPLAGMILEFNMHPARYVHVSWMAPVMSESLFERLRKSGRGERRLSGFILDRFGLTGSFCFDFEDRRRRLALVDGPGLSRLVYFAGIAVNARLIAKTIEKSSLLPLKKSIGEDAYRFALKKAPFLVGDRQFPLLPKGEIPDFRSHATACGMKCLEACLAGEPEALTRRLRLKLPEGGPDASLGDLSGDKEAVVQILRKILVQEVDSGWAPYFS